MFVQDMMMITTHFGNNLDQNSTKQFLGSNGDIGINQPKKIELTLDLGLALF